MPKLDVAKARQLGYTDQQIQAYAQSKGAQLYDSSQARMQEQPAQQDMGFKLSSLLPLLGGIVGGGAGTFLGPAGTIGGGALGSGAGEFIRQKIEGEETNPGAIAGEGALGLFGGAAGKIFSKAGSLVARGTGKALTETGENLAVKGLRLNPSQLTKFSSRHSEDVSDFLTKEGAVGKDIARITTDHVEPLQQQFNAIAKQSGLKANPQNFQKNVLEQIDELLQAGGSENEKIAQQILDEANYLIEKNLAPSSFDISKVDTLRRTFAKKVNWNNPEKAATDYAIADALRKTAIDTADEAGMVGAGGEGLKEIGIKLSKYRDLEKYATAQSNLGRGSLPLGITKWLSIGAGAGGGVPGAAAGLALQTASSSPRVLSAGSRAAMSAGAKLQTASLPKNIGEYIAQGIGQTSARAGKLLMGGSEEDPGTGVIPDPTMGGRGMDNDQVRLTPEAAILLMAKYPKQASVIKAMLELGQPAKKTEAQVARDETGYLVNSAIEQLQNPKLQLGPIGSKVEEFKSTFNAGDPATLSFNRTIAALQASVAKARAGTSFTPNEQKLLDQYTPKVGDSRQQVEIKLVNLQRLFSSQGSSEIGNPTPNYPSVTDAYLSE